MATPRPTCDMNMTPMIDVLLVLLVIFMAALPLTQKGLDVQLPEPSRHPAATTVPDHRVVIEINAGRQVAINREAVAREALQERLEAIFSERRDKTLFISAARTLRYRDVIDVIDAAKGAGVKRVGIITDGMRQAAGG